MLVYAAAALTRKQRAKQRKKRRKLEQLMGLPPGTLTATPADFLRQVQQSNLSAADTSNLFGTGNTHGGGYGGPGLGVRCVFPAFRHKVALSEIFGLG